jgi:glycosyltransferase involved in cell wall biosynthesis
MNILVNGRFLSRQVTGVERYGHEIMRRLPVEPRVARPYRDAQGAKGHAWEQFILPGQIRSGEVLWSPANTGPLAVNNQVLSLLDLSSLEHPEWYALAFARWYYFLLPWLVRRVKQVVVPSEKVRQKVLYRFRLDPERISVVPGGVDMGRFRPDNPPPEQLPTQYVLFVGSIQLRKNLGVLLRAWERVRGHFPDVWLLIAGGKRRNFRHVDWPGRGERVNFLGYVPEPDLPGLYTGAQLLICPSLDEGFGLPVLEAMASGTPVIAACAGALPEVVGEAGLLFDPLQPVELATALECCLGDNSLRRNLAEKGWARSRGYTWQHSADILWEVLQK